MTGDRRRRLSAPFRLRNYRAAFHSLHTYERPADGLRRYVAAGGCYPWTARLRTPVGTVAALVPTQHDIRTVNEVFCRRDYGSGSPSVVVDVGANIGISALFFLTRSEDCVVHCYEPSPTNLPTLQHNLSPFGDRAVIRDVGIAQHDGWFDFYLENVGRYSGLAEFTQHPADATLTRLRCLSIADELRTIIGRHGSIDLLKVDTEGSEQALIDAVPRELWLHIGEVRYELPGHVVRRPGWKLAAERSV